MFDKKIAIIEPVGGHGGMDFYNYGLALGLSNNNCEVYLFTSSETSVRNYKNVITYKTFEKLWSRKNKAVKMLYFLKEHLKSYKVSKQHNVGILHFHFFELDLKNYLILKLAKWQRFKIVVTIHDVSSFQGTYSNQYSSNIAKMANKIIVHNEVSAKEIKELNLSQNPNIISHGNYLPFIDAVPSKNYTENSPLKLLFFGQVKEVKGLDVLLDALKILKEDGVKIHLTIAGKIWKDDAGKYIEKIKDLDINEIVDCHFKYIPNEDVYNYFNDADLVVLPYRKIYQSGVLLLAMSYGRPVIVSSLDAFIDIIEDDVNGFVFQNESPVSLGHKLKKVYKDRSRLNQVRKNAHQLLIDRFDWNNIGFQTIEKVYNHL